MYKYDWNGRLFANHKCGKLIYEMRNYFHFSPILYSHYFIECARVYSDGIHFSTCVPISFSFALFDMNTLLIHKMSSSFTFYSSPLAACMPIFSLNASTNVCFLLMFISIRQIKLIVFSLFRLSAMWGVEALPIPNSYEKILSLYKMNINPFCSIYIEYCSGVCVCVCVLFLQT